jgi:hypothetical protein
MPLSVHAAFLAAIAGAVRISAQGTTLVRPIPITLTPVARELFSFSADAPDKYVQKSSSFRCMGGNVWLCNTGANLVCGKANTSRSSAGASDFCQQTFGCRSHGRHGSRYDLQVDMSGK